MKSLKTQRGPELSRIGAQGRLVFRSGEDRKEVLDLMRRFSSAVRYAYHRLLEGWSRNALKQHLQERFGINSRYADDAILKAQATLASVRERGQNPKKVIFGGRKLFEQLKQKHLSGRRYARLQQAWREKRRGTLYARGDKTRKGNLNARLLLEGGVLYLRITVGHREWVKARFATRHRDLGRLLEVVLAGDRPYSVELSLKEGQVYAHVTFTPKEPPELKYTRANGALGVDVNAYPFHLAWAVAAPDGNLLAYGTVPLHGAMGKPKGEKELLLWKAAHEIVGTAKQYGVAVVTEKLKHLRKTRRGDGSGRRFRSLQHRFAYRSLLEKIHAVARRKGVEVVEKNAAHTSTIGMLKYAPQYSLTKDVAAAFVLARRGLGLEEKPPRCYGALLEDREYLDHARKAYAHEIAAKREALKQEKNPYLRKRLRREVRGLKRKLDLLSPGREPGARVPVTGGRNGTGGPLGVRKSWRVAGVAFASPLLGRAVPRDLSPLKPVLVEGAWERVAARLGPHPGGGPGCTRVH